MAAADTAATAENTRIALIFFFMMTTLVDEREWCFSFEWCVQVDYETGKSFKSFIS